MWAKEDYLELAFYPTSTQLVGSVFQSLCFYQQNMIAMEACQLEPNAHPQYHSSHVNEWICFKEMLIKVQNFLQNHCDAPVLVRLDKQPIPLPSSEGYGSWSTDHNVTQCKAYFA